MAPAQDVPRPGGQRARSRRFGAHLDHAAASGRAPEQPSAAARALDAYEHHGPVKRLASRVSSSRPMHTPAPAAARSNVVPFTSRLATAERLDDAPTEIGEMPRLAAAVRRSLRSAAVSGGSRRRGDGPARSQAPDRRARLARPVAPSERSRKQPPWIVIAMIAGAVAFGAVAALSIFIKPAPAPAPIAQGAAAPPTATTAAPPVTAARRRRCIDGADGERRRRADRSGCARPGRRGRRASCVDGPATPGPLARSALAHGRQRRAGRGSPAARLRPRQVSASRGVRCSRSSGSTSSRSVARAGSATPR